MLNRVLNTPLASKFPHATNIQKSLINSVGGMYTVGSWVTWVAWVRGWRGSDFGVGSVSLQNFGVGGVGNVSPKNCGMGGVVGVGP